MQQVQVRTPEAPGQPMIATHVPAGTPQTPQEYRSLMAKRGELSNQLVSAADRRRGLADQLKAADPSARPGIEARLKVLDDRIVRLESERERPALGAGAAEPLRASRKSAISTERG